ncbi:hypothetical protein [Streptomyces sp. NPDC003077]|uniref:hypothetical protein n=1 Tax=Streptomyces sp. NPDC003077 TaxID=3154443 RepID=UPI0033B64A07
MFRLITRGAVAGAAGTSVLNAVTYGDMAWRGRPTSNTPQETLDTLATVSGHPVPGRGEERDNRLTGLGSLSGIAVGTAVGVAVAIVRGIGIRPPLLLGGILTGALAMAASDLPMARLKVSDPTSWSAGDWVSDAVPHLAYGLATYGALVVQGRR